MGEKGGKGMGWLRALLAPAADPRGDEVESARMEQQVRMATERASATRAWLEERTAELRSEAHGLERDAAGWVGMSRDDLALRSLRVVAMLREEAEQLAGEARAIQSEEQALRSFDLEKRERAMARELQREGLEARRIAAQARSYSYFSGNREAASEETAAASDLRARAERESSIADEMEQIRTESPSSVADLWAAERLRELRDAAARQEG